MRARRRTADVLLVAAMLLLAVAAVHRIRAASAEHRRRVADERTFARYVAGYPGQFVRLRVTAISGYDLTCARHRRTPSRPADFQLCARVPHGARDPQVASANVVGLRGAQLGVRHRCAGAPLRRARCRPRTGPFARSLPG